jgi:hypothetical protein
MAAGYDLQFKDNSPTNRCKMEYNGLSVDTGDQCGGCCESPKRGWWLDQQQWHGGGEEGPILADGLDVRVVERKVG